jgi:hypothetical protein
VSRIRAPASPAWKYITLKGDRMMSDPTKYTEKTEVTTETKRDDGFADSEYKKETTVKTEHTVEKEEEKEPVVVITEN